MTMKMLRKIDQNRISKDRGSTLITVIVAIAFVTILTSIILGTTVVNVRMKGIDKRTKDDFYYAEKSLNDIYTGLGQELAVLAGDQYDLVFKKLGTDDGTFDFDLAEDAEKNFRETFVEETYDLLDGLDEAALQAYILPTSKGHVDSIGSVEYQKKDGSTPANKTNAYRVALRKVQVSVTDTTGFRSVITTDIIITIPTVDFLGTNADVSDYGLIANKGLYIYGGSSATTINGNVYAGVHDSAISGVDADFTELSDSFSKDPIYGGINIKGGKVEFNGNYIISKGDINITGTDPQFKVNSPAGSEVNYANLWFSSIRTLSGASIPTAASGSTIDISANTFALNDMVLNADNSSVTIDGNYYGYNDGGDAEVVILGKKTGREDSDNSAIIINGSNAYLDMKDINNFVLMGKAYIDFTSDSETNPAQTPSQVVPTAESVALKTNQQLYLVPTDFLDGANPIENPTNPAAPFNISISETNLKNWFGYKYLDNSAGDMKIDKSYTVTLDSGSKVYYDYLKFDNSKAWFPDGHFENVTVGTGGSVSSKTRFFYDIMTSRQKYADAYAANHEGYSTLDAYIEFKESDSSIIQPSAYRLYDRINKSMGYDYFNLKECIVGDEAAVANAHYYAKNAVINYKRVSDPDHPFQSTVRPNTVGMLRYSNYTKNLFRRYVWLCTKLDGKEDKLLDAPTDLPDYANEWKITYPTGVVAPPISHFVKVSNVGAMALSTSMSSADSEGLKQGPFGVVIAKNSDIAISTSDSDPGEKIPAAALIGGKTFRGVAIVDGNITVGTNIDIDGLLIATGTITLKGNNNINYNKGLLQARIEKEMNIVKNKDEGVTDPYKDYYLINYLSKDGISEPELIYQVEAGSKIRRDRVEADYNDFVHYENWQKGEE